MISYGPAKDLWIRNFTPITAESTYLVCFPYAGGSAGYYAPFSAALSPGISLLAIQYPGRQDRYREKCMESLREIADESYAVLASLRAPKLSLFGHSMGAIVAFEVARRFCLNGTPGLLNLFVSGRRAPSRWRPGNIHALSDSDLLRELYLAGGTDPRLLADRELQELVIPPARADFKAIETYECTAGARVSCPITAFTGRDDPQATVDEVSAWGEHSEANFEMQVFPGGHFYLNDHRADLLSRISKILQNRSFADKE